jgi:ribosome biogenesis GTPase A
MNINWYPGHMAKTMRAIEANLKLVDAVCVLLDARIPRASLNPGLTSLNRPLLYILTRADIADPLITKLWIKYFNSQGIAAVSMDARTGAGKERLLPAVRELLAEKLAARAEKGQAGRAVRLMIVGIPNVGKSSLINRVAGRKSAKVEDRPGVTRGKQWIDVSGSILLLDMPGVLQPRLDDAAAALNLAFTGAIKDKVLDTEELAVKLIDVLAEIAPNALAARCKWEVLPDMRGYELLCFAAKSRGCVLRGNEPDTERFAALLLDEFRAGKMGRITLEKPEC